MTNSCTYVILLNWNGWKDTIACLESLFQSSGAAMRVVVCDNNSSDDSLSKISDWARGHCPVELPDDERLRDFMGSVNLPVNFAMLSATDVNAGRITDNGEPLVLINNENNDGFAAGNNVGLRYALDQDDMSHVWILNNDTVVDPGCLSSMLRRLQQEKTSKVCGSIIHFYDNPTIIQAIGGSCFNTRTGVASQTEGRFRPENDLADCYLIEQKIDYLSGCSMLIPRDVLERVGLLNEDYFLYYEEIDWFTRAGKFSQPCIAVDAHVYHREGGSIGSPSWRETKPSLLADFHIFRSKHLFMQQYYRENMLWCYATSWLEIGKRIVRGQFRNAFVVLSVLFGATRLRP
jgi:GT2 family glycosyltransferase